MDRERLLENERLQMEQTRELDSEELQIEEVDSSFRASSDEDDSHNSGRGDGGAGLHGGFTFDTCLASLHTYLGEVDDTRGRLAFLDGGAILNVPMFYLEGVVLFPEATLPLRVIQPRFIAAVERALNQFDAPYTIGVVRVYRQPDDGKLCFATTGTTAEIDAREFRARSFQDHEQDLRACADVIELGDRLTCEAVIPQIRQYRRLDDGTLNVIARGQQRFRLRRCWIDGEGAPCADIQIVQEDLPLRTPRAAFGQLASISNLKYSFSQAFPSGLFPAEKHAHVDAENDSECMSTASISSDHSEVETRMCISGIDSPAIYERINESSSSDDELLHGRWKGLQKSCSSVSRGSSGYNCHKGLSGDDQFRSGSVEEYSPGKISIEKLKSSRVSRNSRGMHMAAMSFWPCWIYQMYDSYSLAHRAAELWRQIIIGNPSLDDYKRRPDLLSFHIASKLPMSESSRQELLEIDGTSYRLQREIHLLKSFNLVRCKNCRALIAKRSDMVVMSTDGPVNAYVNPHGFVHEVITVHNASGLARRGSPVKEHSWFPGYAWTIINCAVCETNMGWLFTATRKNLVPRSFWGIRSSQVADDI